MAKECRWQDAPILGEGRLVVSSHSITEQQGENLS